jgi:hypothetical protein
VAVLSPRGAAVPRVLLRGLPGPPDVIRGPSPVDRTAPAGRSVRPLEPFLTCYRRTKRIGGSLRAHRFRVLRGRARRFLAVLRGGSKGQCETEEAFCAAAARISALKASPSTVSPSWSTIARVTPWRLALKRPVGSWRAAPSANVSRR